MRSVQRPSRRLLRLSSTHQKLAEACILFEETATLDEAAEAAEKRAALGNEEATTGIRWTPQLTPVDETWTDGDWQREPMAGD